jgi:hypothetical protein
MSGSERTSRQYTRARGYHTNSSDVKRFRLMTAERSRETKRWREPYRGRAAVEREFGA